MEGFTPWPKEFADKYRKAGYWLDRTISEVMDETFAKYSSRTALITPGGRRIHVRGIGGSRHSYGTAFDESGFKQV